VRRGTAEDRARAHDGDGREEACVVDRKPPGGSWQSHIERQIERAQRAGAFDNLPGAGKPIEGLGRPHDELWWLRQFLEREDLDIVPGSLELRRDVEKAIERLPRLPTERAVRLLIGQLNQRIAHSNATHTTGVPLDLAQFDVEAVVGRWRQTRRTGRGIAFR
jgi:hypothetical protein